MNKKNLGLIILLSSCLLSCDFGNDSTNNDKENLNNNTNSNTQNNTEIKDNNQNNNSSNPINPETPNQPTTPNDPKQENPDESDSKPDVEPDIEPTTPSDDEINITGIKFALNQLNMYEGHSYKIAYETLPTNTTKVDVYFKSDIPSIVSVSSNGTLKANKIGKTLVTIITGEGYIDKCVVNVIENPNFKFNIPYADLFVNDTLSLSINKSGTTFTSSDPSVATINSNGQVSALSVGRTLIKAVNSNDISWCDIRVSEKNFSDFIFTDIDSNTCSVSGFSSSATSSYYAYIPSTNIDGKKVVSVSNNAFSYKNVQKLILPNSIVSIGNNALASIKDSVFYAPYNLETIGDFAFMSYDFKTIEFNRKLKSIGLRCFINCHSFNDIIIPSGVEIGEDCFHDCYGSFLPGGGNAKGLTNVYIEEGVTFNGKETFYGCKDIENINIPTSLTSLENSMFVSVGTNISGGINIFIPNNIISIPSIAYTSEYESIRLIVENDTLPSGYDESNNYYLYSKDEPTSEGKYYHYVKGEITLWE